MATKKPKIHSPKTRQQDFYEASKIRVKPLAKAVGDICQNWAWMNALYTPLDVK